MSGLPEPDRPRLAAKHNGVIPAPHHSIKAARYLSDGYQMTRRDPLPPRRRELRYVPDGDNLAPDQDLAGILSDTSTMPQRSRGVIKAPVAGAATHRVCLSDIAAPRDLDTRTAAHRQARTVPLEHHRAPLCPAHGAKCGCLTSEAPPLTAEICGSAGASARVSAP